MWTTIRRVHLAPLFVIAIALVATALSAPGCSGSDEKVLYIGGIPDQDVSLLEARFETVAEFLSDQLDLNVEYLPSDHYSAVVTGFKNNDIQLGWYGGLTGVQARLVVPDAEAFAQRPRDEEFHSVFVADPALGLSNLADVAGLSLTFGSESSTSGHLMPRSFLIEAGVDPEDDLDGPPSYSGSHDVTWKLVESGAFQVGALNEAVWEARVAAGEVNLSKVDVLFRTPSYYDYHWVVRGDLDEEFGEGMMERLRAAVLSIDASKGGQEAEIAEAFQTERFIETNNDNYKAIEDVAIRLGIIEQ
jgi:phosphonate transport system substrate-binding protein